MSKVYSNSAYKYIKKLEEKLTTLNGKIDENIYNSYSKEIDDIKQQLIGLSDSSGALQLKPIIAKISALEFRFENELEDAYKDVVKESILAQLNIVERYVAKDLIMVEEMVGKISAKLAEAKDIYDDVEYDKVEAKLLGIVINCNIERAKSNKEIDGASINRFLNDNGYMVLRNLIATKGQEAEGIEKAIIESWQTQIIDIKTGLVDKDKMKEIVSNPRFWEILSGAKKVKYEENKSLIPTDTSNERTYETIRREHIEQIAGDYGFRPEQLKVGKSEVLSIMEVETLLGKIKYKIVREKILKWQQRKNTSNVVAYVFSNDIREICSDIEKGSYKLRDIVFPADLRKIGIFTFCNSQIKSIDFPENLEHIGQRAFCGCRRLTSLEFNSELEYIAPEAFCGCDNLSSVSFNDKLKSIGFDAFHGTRLTYVQIPMGVGNVSKNTFPEKCVVETMAEEESKKSKSERKNEVKPMEFKRANRRGVIER